LKKIFLFAIVTCLVQVMSALQITPEIRKRAIQERIEHTFDPYDVIELAQKAIDEGLESSDLYYQQGLALLSIENYPTAKESFQRSLQISDNPPLRLNWILDRLSHHGLFRESYQLIAGERARADYRSRYASVSVNWWDEALNTYSFLDCLGKDDSRTSLIEFLKLSSSTDPDLIDLIRNMLDEYDERQGYEPDLDTALEELPSYIILDLALKKDPDHFPALQIMHEVNYSLGDYENSKIMASRALARKPEHYKHFFPLFWLSVQADDYETAYLEFKALVSSEKDEVAGLLKLKNSFHLWQPIVDGVSHLQTFPAELPLTEEEVAIVPTVADTLDYLPSQIDQINEYYYESIPEYIAEEVNLFSNFVTWMMIQDPSDQIAIWLKALTSASVDHYECKRILTGVTPLSDQGRSLLAYLYYLEDDYIEAYSWLSSMKDTRAGLLCFSRQQLASVYSCNGDYSIALEYVLENHQMIYNTMRLNDTTFGVSMDASFFNEFISFLQLMNRKGGIMNIPKQYIDPINDLYIADFLLWNGNLTIGQIETLMGLVANKFDVFFVVYRGDMNLANSENQASEKVGFSSWVSMKVQLEVLANFFMERDLWKEAIPCLENSYYILENEIDTRDKFLVLVNLFKCYHLSGQKTEARMLLDNAGFNEFWGLYYAFEEAPFLVNEYSDWIVSNLGYHPPIVSALVEQGLIMNAFQYMKNNIGSEYWEDNLYRKLDLTLQHPGWKPYIDEYNDPLATSDELYLYLPKPVAYDDDSLTIWNMYVALEEPVDDWDETYTKELWKYDFVNGRYLCLQSTKYRKDNRSMDLKCSENWEYPIPGSVGEIMFEYTRKLHRDLLHTKKD